MEEELPNFPPLFVEDHAVQFEQLAWRDSNGVARYANHSCEPNCGIRDFFTITTMRQIEPGEEITWDYAMTEDDGEWTMPCMCNSPMCRGVIRGYSFLPDPIKQRYAGFVSEWLLDGRPDRD